MKYLKAPLQQHLQMLRKLNKKETGINFECQTVTYWKALAWMMGFFPLRRLSSISHSSHVWNIPNI